MSESPDKPKQAKPRKGSAELELGDYFSIGLVGGKLPEPDEKSGIYRPRVYDGFRNTNGYGHWVKRSSDSKTKEGALEFVAKVLIPELQANWLARANRLGLTPEQMRSASNKDEPPPEGSLEEELQAWKARHGEDSSRSQSTWRGYKYALESLIRNSDFRVKQPGYVFTKADCAEIRDGMLKECKKPGGRKKLMENTRYVLKQCPRFPIALVPEFEAPKINADQTSASKQDFPFTAAERAIIWQNLSKADSTTRGIILVAANSTQHGTDVANITVKELRRACEDICVLERNKTDVEYRFVAWEETRAWSAEMKFHPDAIHAFKAAVYSRKELKNPRANLVPLVESKEQAEKRRADAASRAAKLVKKFLVEVCEITRPGTSMHSFRYTNVSEWEAEGFPRIACMACSGHVKEENYIGYAVPIREHIKRISQTTHDFWKHAAKERLYIFTKAQLYEALVVVIKQESDRTIAALEKQHFAHLAEMRHDHDRQLAEIHKDHAVQSAAMREAHEMQLAEMRKNHAQQSTKMDLIIRLLRNNAAGIQTLGQPLNGVFPDPAHMEPQLFPADSGTEVLPEAALA
jgi:hypothetical protein